MSKVASVLKEYLLDPFNDKYQTVLPPEKRQSEPLLSALNINEGTAVKGPQGRIIRVNELKPSNTTGERTSEQCVTSIVSLMQTSLMSLLCCCY